MWRKASEGTSSGGRWEQKDEKWTGGVADGRGKDTIEGEKTCLLARAGEKVSNLATQTTSERKPTPNGGSGGLTEVVGEGGCVLGEGGGGPCSGTPPAESFVYPSFYPSKKHLELV